MRPEVIEAWTDAHGVMPGQRECPPNNRAEDALPDGEREDVSFLGENPGHQRSADQRDRNENRIRPVKQAEEGADNQRNPKRITPSGEKAIGNHRIEGDLLQKAE